MTILSDDTASAGNDTVASDTVAGGDTVAGADTVAGGDPKKDEAPVVPEKYEFKFAEGVKVDEARLAKFSEAAKSLKLTQEQAQSLADQYAEAVAEGATAQTKAWETMVAKWGEDARTDKEFGGTNFDANVGLANKVLTKYGTPQLRQTLNETGVGNHPEIIRLLVKIGKDISEDAITPGGSPAATGETSAAKRLYPNMA